MKTCIKRKFQQFSLLLWLLLILIVMLIIRNMFKGTDEQSEAMLLLLIIFLTSLMWSTHKILKQHQKRIDALEEKLNNQKEQHGGKNDVG